MTENRQIALWSAFSTGLRAGPGVTGYVDLSIPRAALEGLRDQLLEDLGMTLDDFRNSRSTDD